MCGIAGIVQFEKIWSAAEARQHLQTMIDALAHRGPDGEGVWVSEQADYGLAHRRLSIIDLSDTGQQPMWSHDQRFCISFNGEIYNYQEIRQELVARGARFVSQSDTEVLLEAYRAYGAEVLQRIDGMFAFAILDTHDNSLFIARDPFGEKPLYYSYNRQRLIFASELEALRRTPGFDDTVLPRELAKYLSLQYFDGEACIYQGARKLLPGHFIRLVPGQPLKTVAYFSFAPRPETMSRHIDDWADELEDILVQNLRRRLRADVPVGAFLSAGVDSSTVVALARKKLDVSLHTFSIGFTGSGASEHEQAAEIAQYLDVPHEVRLIGPDDLARADEISSMVDEPSGDGSFLPTLLLSEFARQRVKVALSGDGADELFGGYGRYMQTLAEERLGESGIASAGRRYYSNRILVHTPQDVDRILATRDTGLREYLQQLQREVDDRDSDLVAALRQTDARHYLPGAVLAKVDRMSMRHGLEVRTPFLNIPMARFAERLPTELVMNEHTGKVLLKHLAARYLPREWLDRPKRGFGWPSYQWAGKALRQQVKRSAADRHQREKWWQNTSGTLDWVNSIEKNNDNGDYKYWALLQLDGFLLSRGGKPPTAFDMVKMMALNARLANEKSVLLFSFHAISGIRDLLPRVAANVALWTRGQTSALSFDWLARPADAVAMLRQKCSTLVIYDEGINLDWLTACLKSSWIKNVLVFEQGQWNKIRLGTNSGALPPKHPPLIFDSLDGMPIRFSRQQLKDDWHSFMRPGRSQGASATSWLFDQASTRPGINTPRRAFRLLSELFDWYRQYSREREGLEGIANWCRNSVGQQGKNKRVALLINDLSPGGAQRQLLHLAKGLQQKAYQVQLITLHDWIGHAGYFYDEFKALGIEVVSCQGNGYTVFDDAQENGFVQASALWNKLPPFIQRQLWSVLAQLNQFKPGAMISFLDLPNIFGGLAAVVCGIPRIVLSFRAHNPSHFAFYQSWFKPYYQTLMRCQRIVFTGNSVAGNRSYSNWINADPRRVKLIRNGVSVPLPVEQDKQELCEKYKLTGKKLILGVFRISEEKRPQLFVDVVSLICRQRDDVIAIIVGDGPLRTSLQARIDEDELGDRCLVVGSQTGLQNYLAISNVVLQTSMIEGTPNTLLEAQYLGIPVVTTVSGGAAEAVSHERSGFVVDSDKAEVIAKSVLKLMDDEELAQQMSLQARQFISERFSVEAAVDKFLDLIEGQ